MSTTPNPNTTTTTTITAAAAVISPSRPLTTVTAANTAGVRAQTPQAQSPSVTHPIQLFTSIPNQNPPQNQGRVYAFAPSPRGYAPRGFRPQQQDLPHPPHHAVGVSYRPTSTIGFNRSHPRPRPQFIFDDAHLSTHLIRPYPQLQHYMSGSGGGGNGGVLIPPSSVKGTPVSPRVKSAASPAPFPNSNGFKNLRDRSKEDTVITVRDRKVRITDGASLYALCRSWLRNGFPEDSQPHFGDVVKSLPRPLPIPVVDTDSPKNENEEVENNDVEEESIDQVSTEDLLKRHVQRAKKVRARLREERLKRIARYKTRLALLLPPQLEQLKADAESGN